MVSRTAVDISLKDIQEAAKRIKPHMHRTLVMTSSTLDSMAGRALHFKCEVSKKPELSRYFRLLEMWYIFPERSRCTCLFIISEIYSALGRGGEGGRTFQRVGEEKRVT